MTDFSSWMDGFRAAGGRHGFGIPGGGASLQVAEALELAGGQFIVTGHEQTAALMAGGVYLASGQPSLCTSIKGPGFASLLPGLQCNAYEGFAHLAMCEAYPAQDSGTRRHKWMDHARLCAAAGLRHGAFEPGADAFQRAWSTALREAPGPVLLDLAPGPGIADLSETAPPSRTGETDEVISRIHRAERPIVIAGGLARRAAWRGMLADLHLPVFTTPAAKGAVDEHSPFAAGVFTGAGTQHSAEAALLPLADLVVLLGVRHGELLGPVAHGSTLWLDAMEAAFIVPPEPSNSSPTLIHSAGFSEILEALGEKSWGDVEIHTARHALRGKLAALGWTPAAIAEVFAPASCYTTHVLDTGNFTVLAEHLLPAGPRTQVAGTPNGRWMGAAAGIALGAAFSVASGKTSRDEVVLWIGDGGIRSLGFELRLAIEARLPLLVLVMADGYFGSVRGRVKKPGLREGTLRLSSLDLRGTFERMGFACHLARSDCDVGAAVEQWRRQARPPAMVICEFDPAAYEEAGNLLR